MLKIPMVDLRRQDAEVRGEIEAAMHEVLEECSFVRGPTVGYFEEEFTRFCGVRYAVAVANGTDALELALRALGVGEGDEVITSPFTFFATAEAICLAGARPAFADISEGCFTLDPEKVEAAVTPRTRAILPVHLYGQPAEMGGLRQVAERHGLSLVEDAAQAHGARYQGRRVGSLGEVAAFSFYPSKNLGAYGDGGIIVTDREEVAHRARLLRDHGSADHVHHEMIGRNSRLDSLQAALLSVKLGHLDRWNARRRELADLYRRHLADLPGITLPGTIPASEPVYHLFVIRSERRSLLQEALREAGIGTGIHYALPLHLQEAFSHLGLRRGAYPAAEAAADSVLSLPMHPALRDEEVLFICQKVEDALAHADTT